MHTSNLIAYAAPVFTFLILCEFLYGYFRNKNNYRLNDTFTSLSLGMISRFPSYLRLGVQGLVYAWIYQSFNFGILDSYDAYVWVIAFVLYDLSYYWLHRCHHEIKILWASHVVHHHGEEFNLSTALRQTGTDFLFKWIFYCPLLFLGVPPEIFVTVAALNLIYQFWVHTEHIDRLGIIDYILVTPSNHRIHHAQNKEYVDANYGGVFIIWDRIFGTFIDERKDLKPVYGTSKPLKSWNPFWANFEVWVEMIRDSWRTEKWSDKVRVWFSRPKWRPEDVSKKFPIEKNDMSAFHKYDPKINLTSKIFAFSQLVFGSSFSMLVFFDFALLTYLDLFLVGFVSTTTLVCASFLFENNFYGYYFELFRSVLVMVLISLGNLNYLQEVLIGHSIISMLICSYVILFNRKRLSGSIEAG